MNTESTPHHINAETVESIVDKYMGVYGYSYSDTRYEIIHNFAIDEFEIQRALSHLEDTYKPGKVPVKHNRYDPGDISDVVGG